MKLYITVFFVLINTFSVFSQSQSKKNHLFLIGLRVIIIILRLQKLNNNGEKVN